MTLVFNKNLNQLKSDRKINDNGKVQKVIDTAVVKYCDAKVPLRSGVLKKAVGTVYGSGTVKYNTPYAKTQYYSNTGYGAQGTSKGGQRGKLWFERMKQDSKQKILAEAKREAGAE
jgi:hypothetical protein